MFWKNKQRVDHAHQEFQVEDNSKAQLHGMKNCSLGNLFLVF